MNSPAGATFRNLTRHRQTRTAVGRSAGLLFGKGAAFGTFFRHVADFIGNEVYHASDVAVAQSSRYWAGKYPDLRYARVPQGPTCPWCIVLASRGFDYASAESAGVIDKFHDGCDCRIVAGFGDTEVEGYDHKGMYDRYSMCRKTIDYDGQLYKDWCALTPAQQAKYKSFNDYTEKRIVKETGTRDRQWLYDGTKPAVAYEKARDALNDSECHAVDVLKACGIQLLTVLEDGAAPANFDLMFLAKKEYWEVKNMSNAENSVSNQTQRSRAKYLKRQGCGTTKTVATMLGCTDPVDVLVTKIREHLKDGEKCLLVTDDSIIFV